MSEKWGWKYKIGDVILMGKTSRIIVTGRREEECESGTQKYYLIHQITDSFTMGVGVTAPVALPENVLEEMVRLASDIAKKEFKCCKNLSPQ